MGCLLSCFKGNVCVLTAAKEGNIKDVSWYIRQGGNANVADERGLTPLHWASARGHYEIVELLLQKGGANVNVTDKAKDTPLHYAAEHNQSEVCRLLISQGANVNAQNEMLRTPLHIPCREAYPEVILTLMDHGADHKQLLDIFGQTPMDMAGPDMKAMLKEIRMGLSSVRHMVSIKGYPRDSAEPPPQGRQPPEPRTIAISVAVLEAAIGMSSLDWDPNRGRSSRQPYSQAQSVTSAPGGDKRVWEVAQRGGGQPDAQARAPPYGWSSRVDHREVELGPMAEAAHGSWGGSEGEPRRRRSSGASTAESLEDMACPACPEGRHVERVLLPCAHNVCWPCAQAAKSSRMQSQHSCPVCGSPIDDDQVRYSDPSVRIYNQFYGAKPRNPEDDEPVRTLSGKALGYDMAMALV